MKCSEGQVLRIYEQTAANGIGDKWSCLFFLRTYHKKSRDGSVNIRHEKLVSSEQTVYHIKCTCNS